MKLFSLLYKFKDLPNKREKKKKIKSTLPRIKENIIGEKAMRARQWLLTKINELEIEYK